MIRTQAVAFLTAYQSAVNKYNNISVPEEVLSCMQELLDPDCKHKFFIDWTNGGQALLVFGALAFLCLFGIATYKPCCGPWRGSTTIWGCCDNSETQSTKSLLTHNTSSGLVSKI